MVNVPLAYRMRPIKIQDYLGQQHLLGEKQILSRMLQAKRIVSMLFYGDPGVGKTTLAKLLARSLDYCFVELSAVTSGVKDIKGVVEQAKVQNKQKTVLFLDEIHRFNKTQQDALLPHVESGLITLIGATTENPFFAINNALLSRLTVLRLKPLQQHDIELLIEQAISQDEELQKYQITFEKDLKVQIFHISEGDCRKALNLLETAFMVSVNEEDKSAHIDMAILKVSAGEYAHKIDRGGDCFYDQLSAFHKSVRGSDPDAAIFWLANMIESGSDPLVIARRMLCIASEDIGNADPRALTIALDAWQSYERLGLPEGRLPLIQAAIYLAVAPKSNASYMAYKAVFSDLKNYTDVSVPLHLRNTKPAGQKAGEAYKYPHDYHNAWVKQQYLPTSIDAKYYKPTARGLESKISAKLQQLSALNK